MNITNFSSCVRMGSAHPASIDIHKIGDHESVGGVMATAFTYRSEPEHGFTQVRKDDIRVALFAFAYDDGEADIPSDWKGSIVIWDSRS